MLDHNDYPTEETLEKIKNYDPFHEDIIEFIEYLRNNWNYADIHYFRFKRNVLELHTGGWSGNEDVIQALKENIAFWHIFWWKTVVGGHYYFKIKKHPILKKCKNFNCPHFQHIGYGRDCKERTRECSMLVARGKA